MTGSAGTPFNHGARRGHPARRRHDKTRGMVRRTKEQALETRRRILATATAVSDKRNWKDVTLEMSPAPPAYARRGVLALYRQGLPVPGAALHMLQSAPLRAAA